MRWMLCIDDYLSGGLTKHFFWAGLVICGCPSGIFINKRDRISRSAWLFRLWLRRKDPRSRD